MTDLLKDYETQLENYRRLQVQYKRLQDGITSGEVFKSEILRIYVYLAAVHGVYPDGADFIDKAALLHYQISEENERLRKQNAEHQAIAVRLQNEMTNDAHIWYAVALEPALHQFGMRYGGQSFVKAVVAFACDLDEQIMARYYAAMTAKSVCDRLNSVNLSLKEYLETVKSAACEREAHLEADIAYLRAENAKFSATYHNFYVMHDNDAIAVRQAESQLQYNKAKFALMRRQLAALRDRSAQLERQNAQFSQRSALSQQADQDHINSLLYLKRRCSTLSALHAYSEHAMQTLGGTIVSLATQLSMLISYIYNERNVRYRWESVCSSSVLAGFAANFYQYQSIRQIGSELGHSRIYIAQLAASRRLQAGGIVSINALGQEIGKLRALIRY